MKIFTFVVTTSKFLEGRLVGWFFRSQNLYSILLVFPVNFLSLRNLWD